MEGFSTCPQPWQSSQPSRKCVSQCTLTSKCAIRRQRPPGARQGPPQIPSPRQQPPPSLGHWAIGQVWARSHGGGLELRSVVKPDSEEGECGAKVGADGIPFLTGAPGHSGCPVLSKGGPVRGGSVGTPPHAGGLPAAWSRCSHPATARPPPQPGPSTLISGMDRSKREANAQSPPADSAETSKATAMISPWRFIPDGRGQEVRNGNNYSQQNNSPGTTRLPSPGCGHSLPTSMAQRPETLQRKLPVVLGG